MKISKPIKFSIYVFLFYIVVTPLIERFYGVGYRGRIGPNEPLDWNEVFQRIPHNLLTGFFLSIVSLWIFIYAFKADEKKWDDIRKANLEKEKLESIEKPPLDSDTNVDSDRLNSDSKKSESADE